jgi:hypothetical protein
MNNAQPGIPSIDLMHEEQKVNFAFRTMEGIHARMGHLKECSSQA